jgi:hypothetical protein
MSNSHHSNKYAVLYRMAVAILKGNKQFFTPFCITTLQLYPAPSRNTGVGITSSLGRIGSIVSPLVIVGLLESCRRKEAVFVVDLVLFLAGVACALLPRETKGCQIQ